MRPCSPVLLVVVLSAAGCWSFDTSDEVLAELEFMATIFRAIEADLQAADPDAGLRRLFYPDGWLMAEYEVRGGELAGVMRIMRPEGRLWFRIDHEAGWFECVDPDGRVQRSQGGPWMEERAQDRAAAAPSPPR